MAAFTATVEHWVSEFLTSTDGELASRRFGDRAGAVLVAFLDGACGSHVPPDEIGESSVRDGVGIGVAPLALDPHERQAVPGLLEAFLGYCQRAGRLGGGEALGAYARVTATAHLLKKQVRKATIKVGP